MPHFSQITMHALVSCVTVFRRGVSLFFFILLYASDRENHIVMFLLHDKWVLESQRVARYKISLHHSIARTHLARNAAKQGPGMRCSALLVISNVD